MLSVGTGANVCGRLPQGAWGRVLRWGCLLQAQAQGQGRVYVWWWSRGRSGDVAGRGAMCIVACGQGWGWVTPSLAKYRDSSKVTVHIAHQQQLARVSLRLGRGTPRGGGVLEGPAREAAARRCLHHQPASHACLSSSPPTCRHCPRCPCCLAPAGRVLPPCHALLCCAWVICGEGGGSHRPVAGTLGGRSGLGALAAAHQQAGCCRHAAQCLLCSSAALSRLQSRASCR